MVRAYEFSVRYNFKTIVVYFVRFAFPFQCFKGFSYTHFHYKDDRVQECLKNRVVSPLHARTRFSFSAFFAQIFLPLWCFYERLWSWGHFVDDIELTQLFSWRFEWSKDAIQTMSDAYTLMFKKIFLKTTTTINTICTFRPGYSWIDPTFNWYGTRTK